MVVGVLGSTVVASINIRPRVYATSFRPMHMNIRCGIEASICVDKRCKAADIGSYNCR